ncbi:hypothetical protein L596_026860 [Steinernema carpocapsae]|uniref:Uncharacterized protein n=1 Tax=Steinernema carpocapsae TaxID=34508 RepID=A0A4U5M2L5_STECR|nr:hypothetical protein L596_026860 [Steinernema carpocapsae]
MNAETVSHSSNAINCAHTPPIPANLSAKRKRRPPAQSGTLNFLLAARCLRTTPILSAIKVILTFSTLNRPSAAGMSSNTNVRLFQANCK